MLSWYFLMGALALLVTLLLCGFVGCAQLADIGDAIDTTDYPTAIKSTPDLVAYWRLGEPSTTPVPSSGGAAKDEVGGFHGDYKTMPAASTPDVLTHSPATTGLISIGVKPGLLQLMSLSPCIDTDGGFVQVTFDKRLNPAQFTLETWVSPDPTMAKGFFHCLVESAGPAGFGQKKTGWGLYLGPDDTNKTPPDDYFWQVWMGNGTDFKRVLLANRSTNPTRLRLTYLVLTFDGTKNARLWLYYPDTGQDVGFPVYVLGDQADVTKPTLLGGPFKPNDASANGKGNFFIGAGRTLFTPSNNLLYPFKGRIQEVALYKKDLVGPSTGAEPFEGLTTTLAPHETAGGNF
jgi:hypothetical protein